MKICLYKSPFDYRWKDGWYEAVDVALVELLAQHREDEPECTLDDETLRARYLEEAQEMARESVYEPQEWTYYE